MLSHELATIVKHVPCGVANGDTTAVGGTGRGLARDLHLVEEVDRGDVARGPLTGLDGAEARVHDRASNHGAARRIRDQDRTEAAGGILFIAPSAAADAAVEEVRVTEADRVTDLVGGDVLGHIGAELDDAVADVD